MKTMKTVAIVGVKQASFIERPIPTAKDDFVVVKIAAIPMCTEYVDYSDGCARAEFQRGDESPEFLGHEAAGEVVEVAQPGRVAVGDRVVVMPGYWCGECYHCMTGSYIHCENGVNPAEATGNEAGFATYGEYIIQNDWMLIPIPDGMSYEHASMACCGLGPALNAMKTMDVSGSDTVLVSGLGPVGLGTVINARYRGARVFGIARNEYRADLGRSLGAEDVFNPEDSASVARLKELTGGYGPNKCVETTGQPMYLRLLMEASRRKGDIAIVGEGGEFPVALSDDMIRNGFHLHGIWHYNLSDTPDMMRMISQVGDSLDKQITHTFPLTDVEYAWNLQLTGKCGKVILKP